MSWQYLLILKQTNRHINYKRLYLDWLNMSGKSSEKKWKNSHYTPETCIKTSVLAKQRVIERGHAII